MQSRKIKIVSSIVLTLYVLFVIIYIGVPVGKISFLHNIFSGSFWWMFILISVGFILPVGTALLTSQLEKNRSLNQFGLIVVLLIVWFPPALYIGAVLGYSF